MKCKPGYYYCHTDKKCKPISKGMKMTARFSGNGKEPTEVANGTPVEDGETSNGNGNGNGGNGMSEETKKDHEYSMARSELKTVMNAAKRLNKKMGKKGEGELKAWVQSKITKAADYIDTAADYVTNEETVDEGTLHKWFKGSKSKDGKGGWVNVVTGGTCASDEPGEGTPKCVSSAKRASMSKAERLSAARRKKKADPGQQQKTGAAKPTYVSTDPKKKMKKEEFVSLPLELEVPQSSGEFKVGLMFRESLEQNRGMLFIFESDGKHSFHMKNTYIPLDIAFIKEDGTIDSIKQLDPLNPTPVTSDSEVRYAVEVNRGWFAENDVHVGDMLMEEEDLTEAKDKKGKGSGKKDACYHKVKSRYSVWPSAYASGALVKCRKKGAANWGNSTKKEETDMCAHTKKGKDCPVHGQEMCPDKPMDEAKKCWPGYEKKGTKMMFGKRYNNCVKKEEYSDWRSELQEKNIELTDAYGNTFATIVDVVKPEPIKAVKSAVEYDTYDIDQMIQTTTSPEPVTVTVDEAVRIPAKTGNIILVTLSWRGKFYMIKMFFPQISKPSRSDVQLQIDKVYPGAKVNSYYISEVKPGEQFLQTEDWQKKSGKNPEGGLNEKGRKSYERQNPGSDLKRPSKKVGNKRRASFCARMKGMKKKLTSAKTANDPDSRINKSLRAWNC